MNPYVHLSPSEMHTFTVGAEHRGHDGHPAHARHGHAGHPSHAPMAVRGDMGFVGPLYPEPTPNTGAVLELPAFVTRQVPAWSILVGVGLGALLTYSICRYKR